MLSRLGNRTRIIGKTGKMANLVRRVKTLYKFVNKDTFIERMADTKAWEKYKAEQLQYYNDPGYFIVADPFNFRIELYYTVKNSTLK